MSREDVEVVQRFIDDWNATGEPPVLTLGHLHARGAQSGATGIQQLAAVMRVRDGQLVGYRSYLRRQEALEAVGLGP